ncbi:MAG: hypothetical protein DSY55_00670, partial [Clostridia bacterium]
SSPAELLFPLLVHRIWACFRPSLSVLRCKTGRKLWSSVQNKGALSVKKKPSALKREGFGKDLKNEKGQVAF